MTKVIKKLFLTPHLEIVDNSLYLGKSLKFSILANGLAKLLEHFSKPKHNFFYFSKAVEDALTSKNHPRIHHHHNRLFTFPKYRMA